MVNKYSNQLNIICQICAIQKEAKNLDPATEIKNVAGEKSQLEANVEGLTCSIPGLFWRREGFVEGIKVPLLNQAAWQSSEQTC